MCCFSCGSVETGNEANLCEACSREKRGNDLITDYFHRGYPYAAIVGLLGKMGFPMHVRTLKRKLKSLGLKRRGTLRHLGQDFLREVIMEEMKGPGVLSGYRSIWHSLRLNHGIHVPRLSVANIIKEVDPDGVENRKARRLTRRKYISEGPNKCWHMDGYDKLKPYGFPIHGAICGYSRRILWLQVLKSNNDPRIPAQLYLDYVKEVSGCPLIVNSDCGTENGIVAAMQCYFRANNDDRYAGENSHRYTSSHSNQRIEAWWSFLKHHRSSWWIDLFKDMREYGMLDTANNFHLELLWFCFKRELQKDLDKVKDHWNSHRIRKSSHCTVSGAPDLLYFLPEYYGGLECLKLVDQDKVEEMEVNCVIDSDQDTTYTEYFEYVLENERWSFPHDVASAFELFQKICTLQS